MVRRDGDGVAHRAVLHQRFGERRAQHSRVGGNTAGITARERPQRLHRQANLLGRRLQCGGVFVNLVHQLAADIGKGLVCVGLELLGSQLVAHLLERLALAALDLTQLDHVVAEFALDRAHHLASLHREQRVLERLDHRALLDPAQVAAGILGTGILRISLRQCSKVGTRLLGLGGKLGSLCLGSLLRGCIGAGTDQDVRRKTLLRLDEARLLVFIALAQRGLVGRSGWRHRGGVELHVFDRHGFRLAEILRVPVVPLLDLRIAHRRSICGRRRQHRQLHIARFTHQLEQALELGRGGKAGLRHRLRDHRLLQAVAHQRIELRWRARRRALRECGAILVRTELTIDLECGNVGNVIPHGRIADDDSGVFRTQSHDLFVDQLIEHLQLVFAGFEAARIEFLALTLTLLHTRLLDTRAEILRADFMVLPQQRDRPPRRRRFPPGRRRLHLGHIVGANAAEVAVVDDEQERNHQQPQDGGSDPA